MQRLTLPRGWDALWLAGEFAAWLPEGLRGLLRVVRTDTGLHFLAVGSRKPLLELSFRPDRSGPDRALFEVSGGVLNGKPIGFPRLEFRVVPADGEALAALHQFRPRLPWWLYVRTQAYAHAWVMWRFGRHLARVARGAPPVSGHLDLSASVRDRPWPVVDVSDAERSSNEEGVSRRAAGAGPFSRPAARWARPRARTQRPA